MPIARLVRLVKVAVMRNVQDVLKLEERTLSAIEAVRDAMTAEVLLWERLRVAICNHDRQAACALAPSIEAARQRTVSLIATASRFSQAVVGPELELKQLALGDVL